MSNDFVARLQAIPKRFAPEHRVHAQLSIQSLLQAGVDSFDRLVAALQHANRDIRINACWALGQIGAKRAVPSLLAAFHAGDRDLQLEAAKSLGQIRSRRAAKPLIAALQRGEDTETRRWAAYALGWLGDERAVEPLIATLGNKNEAPEVRAEAAEALANLGDSRAVSPLIAALKDESVEVRFWATFALGELEDRQVLPELERVATTDEAVLPGWWAVKKEAAEAIERIVNKESDLTYCP